jgi:hypothetical protein
MVQRKCRWTSFDLHRRDRSPANDLRSRPAMNAQKRKLPAAGKGGELPAERGYSVGLAEAIGEESDAKRRCQRRLAMNQFRRKRRDAHRDVLRAAIPACCSAPTRRDGRRSPGRPSHPWSPGPRLHAQHAPQNHGVFVEFGGLAGLGPTRRTLHARDAHSFGRGVDAAHVLRNPLRKIAGGAMMVGFSIRSGMDFLTRNIPYTLRIPRRRAPAAADTSESADRWADSAAKR